MKRIKELLNNTNLKNIYNEFKDSIDLEKKTNKKTLNKRHGKYYEKENKEFITGLIVVGLIILILFSACYYFLVFSPTMEELANEKNIKTNEVNELFKDNTKNLSAKESILTQIDAAATKEEVQSIDVNALAYPVLKNDLSTQINEYKDKYNRVEIGINGTKDIMTTGNATTYIDSLQAQQLSQVSVSPVDSVIVPLSITRKQAASGLVAVGDVVDIYQSNKAQGQQAESSNDTANDTNSTEIPTGMAADNSKLTGGAKVVSILRSKDSGSIEYNMELNEYPNSRNLSQTNTIDVEEVLGSKAIGTLDESQLNLFLSEFGSRLSNYERTSNLGDLDVEYIIMVEVPRESVSSVLSNMDNIILTIPTYDAPSWVDLK